MTAEALRSSRNRTQSLHGNILLVWQTVLTSTNPADQKIFLVAHHLGLNAGGEAIKAYQYAQYLKDVGEDFDIVTHERSFDEMGADQNLHNYHVVKDDLAQKVLWQLPFLRFLLPVYFHVRARQILRRIIPTDRNCVIHYVAPISPVTPRFPLTGHRVVVGPLSGGIYYPPAFSSRKSVTDNARGGLHKIAQRILGVLFKDHKKIDQVLVSGYERTRASLRLAGFVDDQMTDVVDSGLTPDVCAVPRVTHLQDNANFMFSGRLVPVKAIDLALHALARCKENATMTIYGDGQEREKLEAISQSLGLTERVTFHGWATREELADGFKNYRGFLFPSLAESNGIVMQEAMMAGLPVVALKWGGPLGLADDSSAIFIEPTSESDVIQGFADAIDRLSSDNAFAERMSQNARLTAEQRFPWAIVAEQWRKAYKPNPDQ